VNLHSRWKLRKELGESMWLERLLKAEPERRAVLLTLVV